MSYSEQLSPKIRYYTPNPDQSDPMGLLEVCIQGQELGESGHNEEYANLIRRAINASGVDGPQARVMEIYYRGGDIPRELVPHVEETVQVFDVAEHMISRLRDIEEADPNNSQLSVYEIDDVNVILETSDRQGINYLDENGLALLPDNLEFKIPLFQKADSQGLSTDEMTITEQLRNDGYAIDHFVLQSEMVWRRIGEKDRPVLLSEIGHVTVGSLTDGIFNPVATILHA